MSKLQKVWLVMTFPVRCGLGLLMLAWVVLVAILHEKIEKKIIIKYLEKSRKGVNS